jgi:hypothetical protein
MKALIFGVVLSAIFSPHLFGVTVQNKFVTPDGLVPFDSYFLSESRRVKSSRLSLVAEYLKADPDRVAYIVAYGTLRSVDCKGIEELKMAMEILGRRNRLSDDRFVLINGGYRTKGMVEIFILPKDAKFPIPRNTIDGILKTRKNEPK